MTIAYFDCFSGISGDMTLGALLDAGLDPGALTAELGKLGLSGWSIRPAGVHKSGLRATLAHVETEESHHHRHYGDIDALIQSSDLRPRARDLARRVFRRLGEAEAKVHGVPLDEVHFHEVGALDSIVDIVGTCVGLDLLGVTEVYASPLPWTRGQVKTAHGMLPIPAPATVELMRGWPVRQLDIEGELVTPTGAAIITALASGSDMPAMTVSSIGYGAGNRDLEGRPNVLRLLLGEATDEAAADSIIEVASNVDDMNPEWVPAALEAILAAGALDVSATPMSMKKGRPGLKIGALCREQDLAAVAEAILRNTTALGVRHHRVERIKLRRETRTVETTWGSVRVKLGLQGQDQINAAPEYEDCLSLSQSSGQPLKVIYAAALAALER